MWFPDQSLKNLGITRYDINADYDRQISFQHNWQPRYVAVEGADGVGKTTLVTWLAQEFRDRDADVVVVKEPTETLTTRLQEKPAPDVRWACEAFARDRRKLLDTVVLPALQDGSWVISDRSVWSSYAYQVAGLGLDKETCASWCDWSITNTGWPGQNVWIEMGDTRSPAVNKDLLANLQDGDSENYTDAFLRKIDRFYADVCKHGVPFKRWLSVKAKPTNPKTWPMLAGEILAYDTWCRHNRMQVEVQPRIVRRHT